MNVVATLDQYGKPAWITAAVVGFLLWWPVGLGVLGYLIWSGRMGCGKRDNWDEMRRAGGRWRDRFENSRWGRAETSGNSAFDEYRNETLRRLEEEQKEFRDFLDHLRQAKDKAEFDQFMNDRRNRKQGASSDGPEPQPQG